MIYIDRDDLKKEYEAMGKFADKVENDKVSALPDNFNVADHVFLTDDYFLNSEFKSFARCQDIPAKYFKKVDSVRDQPFIFLSHRWEKPDDPDPQAEQFNEMKTYVANNKGKYLYWYDFSCMPQKPRVGDEDAIFKKRLGSLNDVLAGSEKTLGFYHKEYATRSWCIAELMLSSLFDGFGDKSKNPVNASVDFSFWVALLMLYEGVTPALKEQLTFWIDGFLDATKVTNGGDKEFIKQIMWKYYTVPSAAFKNKMKGFRAMVKEEQVLGLMGLDRQMNKLFTELLTLTKKYI